MDEQSRKLLGVLVAATLLRVLLADKVVMKDVTLGFGEALEHCRAESGLTEEMMEEFFHYWRDGFKFEQRELGCALHCMSRYFNLLNDNSRMHHENTEKFIKSFPNGEILAKQMVEIIHECEKRFDHETEHCMRMLRIAECFKIESQQRGIAPNMEMLMAEFIMEVEK